MPIPLAELIASRDWYPRITTEGEVSGVLRFVDLDSPVPADLSSLDSRICLLIGVTRTAMAHSDLAVADHLDLVVSTAPAPDRRVVQVPDLEQAITELTEAANRAPRALLVLASLLRQTAALPIGDGIAAEAAAYSTLLAGPEFAGWLHSRGARKAVPSSESARVETTLQDDVLSIRMTRRLRLNAIDGQMRAALVDAIAIAIADPDLRVRLTGEGPCFSNGGDLREFGTTPDPATAWTVRVTQHPGWQLSQIADRTHVHMHGPCVGAGVEIAAFAKHVSADPASTFLLPELHMGLLPGAGGCVSIPARIGRWRTLWMVLSASTLSAEHAREWGLIDDIAAVD
ncbi:MAG: enoyl-CoA hydratase/isomerase family protein [Actinomycetota bacterium]|nr:enoyl-CoA hydratase/isomerase family protein [Actinomycetota bacterium]MDP2287307.1 enoyl-CoA hydratase/isomerase family protein [Actinomycetota bacterium]